MSDLPGVTDPIEVTLAGKVYVLTPVPSEELADGFLLCQKLVELEKKQYSLKVNPILRVACEQFLLCALKPLYPDLPVNALRAVDGDEILQAFDLMLGQSSRMFEGIDLDEDEED